MKILRILFFVVASAAAVFVLYYSISYYTEKKESNKETALLVNTLVSRKAKIEVENSALKSEQSNCSALGAGIFFLFTEYNDNLKEKIALRLYESKGLTAIICAEPDECNSDDIRFLTEGFSWELAARINKEIAEDGIEEYLERYEIMPEIVYFESDAYNSEYDSMLIEKGIKALVIQGYAPSGNYYTEGNGLIKTLYLPYTVSHPIESLLNDALENKYPVAITMKHVSSEHPVQDKESVAYSSFDTMISSVSGYSKTVHLCNCGEYATEAKERLESTRAHYDEIVAKIAYNISEIDKIKNQISELSKG